MPLAYFGVLLAGYDLIVGLAGRAAALGGTRYGRRPLLAAVGVLPIIAFGTLVEDMAKDFGLQYRVVFTRARASIFKTP